VALDLLVRKISRNFSSQGSPSTVQVARAFVFLWTRWDQHNFGLKLMREFGGTNVVKTGEILQVCYLVLSLWHVRSFVSLWWIHCFLVFRPRYNSRETLTSFLRHVSSRRNISTTYIPCVWTGTTTLSADATCWEKRNKTDKVELKYFDDTLIFSDQGSNEDQRLNR
jgi:hypothetical protein